MLLVLSSLLILIFALLSGLHFYWAFGGKWGIDAALPTSEHSDRALKPKAIATIIVGMGLLSFALFYLVKIGIIILPISNDLLLYIGWILPSIFLIRIIGDFKYVGLFKKIKSTKFAKSDTKYFIPLCAFLAIAGFLIQNYA